MINIHYLMHKFQVTGNPRKTGLNVANNTADAAYWLLPSFWSSSWTFQYQRGWKVKDHTSQPSMCWEGSARPFWKPLMPQSFRQDLTTHLLGPSSPPHTYLPRASFRRPPGQGHKSVPLFSVACPLPLIQSLLRVFLVLAHSAWQLFNKPICFPLTWGRSGGCWRAVRPSWTMKPFPTQHSSSSAQINRGELEINPSYLLFLRKKKKNHQRPKKQSKSSEWKGWQEKSHFLAPGAGVSPDQGPVSLPSI